MAPPKGDLSREVLRALPGSGFFLLDTELRIVFAEGGALHGADHDPATIEGRPVLEGLPASAAEILGPVYARALGGETVCTDVVTETDETTHWVQAAPVRDANGDVTGLTVISLDVSEHRRSEAGVALSEERHRSIVEALGEGVLLIAGDGTILSCNPSAERIFGIGSDKIVGARIGDPRWKAVTEDGRRCPPEELPLSVALRTGEPQLGAILGIRRPDGELRWTSVNAVALEHSGGSPGAVCSFLDITESRSAAEALRRRDEMVTRTMRDAPIGIALLSLEGRYQAVNPAMCQMLGRGADELLKLTFVDVSHPDEAATDADSKRQLISGEIDNWQQPKRYLRPDGSSVTALVSVTVLRDDDGQPTRFVTQAVDITERLRVEAELRGRVDQQSVVSRLGQHALEGVESTRLLDEAAHAIGETLGVDLVSILEICDDGESLRLAAGSGFPDGMVRGLSMPFSDDHRASLEQLREGPLAIDDITASDVPTKCSPTTAC